jgi:hypothetical protein
MHKWHMDLFYHITQNNVPVVNCNSLHPLFLPPSSSGYGLVFKLSDVGIILWEGFLAPSSSGYGLVFRLSDVRIILWEGSFQHASAQIN